MPPIVAPTEALPAQTEAPTDALEPDEETEQCGDVECGTGEYCCNESCSICAPIDGFCIQIECSPTGQPTAAPVVAPTDAPVVAPTDAPTRQPRTMPPFVAPTDAPVDDSINRDNACFGGDAKAREDAMRSQLSAITPEDTLDDTSTPQGVAFYWIVNEDSAQLCPGGDEQYKLNQRYILATLYFSTNGHAWSECSKDDTDCGVATMFMNNENPDPFLSGDTIASECSWAGITCNDDLHVRDIEIPSNNLAGTLPAEITFLSKLDELGLEFNALTGTIPTNPFADGLYRVRLQYNQLEGPLPPIFPESLLALYVEENQLTGTLDSALANLPDLKKLSLQNNGFSGTIPVTVGSVSTILREARFQGNNLVGFMPSEVCINRMNNEKFKKLAVDCDAVDCDCCNPACT